MVINEPIACKLCSKTYKEPRGYRDHLNRVHIQEKGTWEIVGEEKLKLEKGFYKPYKCSKCKNGFTTAYGVTKHLKDKNCKGICDTDLIKIMNNASDPEEIKRAIAIGMQKLGMSNTQSITQNLTNISPTINGDCGNINIKTINVTNNFNIHIDVRNINDENTEYIHPYIESLSDMLMKIYETGKTWSAGDDEVVNNMVNLFLEIYQHIHLNKDHPENHNIYITNLKKNIPFYVHHNNNWSRDGNMDVLNHEVKKVHNLLETVLDKIIKDESNLEAKKVIKAIKEQINYHYINSLEKQLGKRYFDATYNKRDLLKKTFVHTQNIKNIEEDDSSRKKLTNNINDHFSITN